MPPRRDVEAEIYAQLYGEPPQTSDAEPNRVIGDRARELRAPEVPEPPPPPAPRFAKLDDALSWLAAQGPVLKDVARSGRSRVARASPRARGSRPLAIGAVAAAVLGLGIVAALSAGSPDPPKPRAAVSAATAPSAESERTAAREAREARARRVARRRRAARRRAAERAEDRRAESARAEAQPRTTKVLCAEGTGCGQEGAVERRTQSNDGVDDDAESSESRDVDESNEDGGDGDDLEVDTSDADDAENIDIDVDVDEPEID